MVEPRKGPQILSTNLIVAPEVREDGRDVSHARQVVGSVALDKLLDEGSLDLCVLLLDASDGVVEAPVGGQFLGDQLQLLDDVCGLVKARPVGRETNCSHVTTTDIE